MYIEFHKLLAENETCENNAYKKKRNTGGVLISPFGYHVLGFLLFLQRAKGK